MERALLEHHLARFKLAHVQHLVDELQQKAGGVPDLFAALGLLCLVRGIVIADLHHAADAVDGRSDVVRHSLQKLRFGDVRTFRPLRRLLELFLIGLLAAQLLIAVAPFRLPLRVLHQQQHERIADSRKQQLSRCAAKHAALGHICVNVIVAAAVDHAEYLIDRPQFVVHVHKLVVDRLFPDVQEHWNIVAALTDKAVVVGGDDSVAVRHYDGPVVFKAVALQQILKGQAVALHVFHRRMVICNKNIFPVRAAA